MASNVASVALNGNSQASRAGNEPKLKDPMRVRAGKKAKNKGGRGERAAVKYLKALGFEDAKRTVQHNGMLGRGDVECPESLPGVRIEVKYKYADGSIDLGRKGLDDAITQATIEASALREQWCILWILMNSQTWKLTFLADNPSAIVTVYGDNDIRDSLRWLCAGLTD